MKRTFIPVGQGAFYCEKFYNDSNDVIFTMVYDCGTIYNKNQSLLINYINNEIQNNVIDILFISHFHKDHISGLKYLLKNYTIKKIYVPNLTFDEIIFNELCIINDFGINSFELNYFESIYCETKYDDIFDEKNRLTIVEKVGANNINISNWYYIPYIPTTSQKQKIWTTCSKNIFNSLNISYQNSTHNVVKILKNKYSSNIKTLKNIYKRYYNDLNNTSIVLYSGPKNQNQVFNNCLSLSTSYNINTCKGCIYFGDFDINSDLAVIFNFVSNFSDIGCIQIPHHGSEKNYHSSIFNVPYDYYIISVGHNRYGHPSIELINEFKSRNVLNNVFFVNENISSKVVFE